MKNPAFYYRSADQEFIEEELARNVRNGKSVVLLGPPNAGKGYLCRELYRKLESPSGQRPVMIDLAFGNTITTEEGFRMRLSQAVVDAGGDPVEDRGSLLKCLETLDSPRPVLIASNIDSVAHSLARAFLQEVRERVEDDRLTVVLTGGYDLQQFVDGENSVFTAAKQYVLQGFGQDAFKEVFRLQCKARGVEWIDFPGVSQWLCSLSGGNVNVTRALLETGLERQFHLAAPGAELKKEEWDRNWMQAQLADSDFRSLLYRRMLTYSIPIISADSNCWNDLKSLLKSETPQLSNPLGPPDALTLAGVSIRDEGVLKFSSELMNQAACAHFTNTRLADLYAYSGNWVEAMPLYRAAPAEDRLRPISAVDYADTERLLNSVSSSLQLAAVEGTDAVYSLFEEVAKICFGLEEIVLWQRLGRWQIQSPAPSAHTTVVSNAAQRAGEEILNEEPVAKGIIPIGRPWTASVIGAVLEGRWRDQPCAVLAGGFNVCEPLTRERRRVVTQLMDDFRRAYDCAATLDCDRMLLRYRDAFEDLTRQIVAELGRQILDVDSVLNKVAWAIHRELGYRRVYISMVNSAETEIRGRALAQVEGTSFAIDPNRHWDLDKPDTNIHPWVVHSRQALAIDDARIHPLTKKELDQDLKAIGAALVPLLTATGRVIGTLYLERDDKTPFSREEIDEFTAFGRTITALIEQGERTEMMQTTLDQIPEALLIVDRMQRIRYGNQRAAVMFPTISPGRWRSGVGSSNLRELAPIGDVLQEIYEGHPVFLPITEIGKTRFRGVLRAGQIRGGAGAFIHIQDLDLYYRVLSFIEEAAIAPNQEAVASIVLNAFMELGHTWGHLWTFDKTSGTFVGKEHFNSPYVNDFAGKKLPSLSEAGKHKRWRCMRERRVFVFDQRDTDHEYDTARGIHVHAVSDPHEVLKNRKGLWIEFPLLAGEEWVGKVVAPCDSDLTLEHLEGLKALLAAVSVIFQGFAERDSIWRVEAERSLHALSHNLATQFAFLPQVFEKYKRFEKDLPQMASVNDEVAKDIQELYGVVESAKLHLNPVTPQFAKFDLVALLKECEAPFVRVTKAPADLEVQADPTLLKGAIKELLVNSLRYAKSAEGSPVAIEVEKRDHAAMVTISDRGPGIPEEHKEKIFDRFFRYNPYGLPGTGLGLSFVRRVVEAHGGRIRECGTPGKGARFVLEVACADGKDVTADVPSIAS